MPKQMLFLALNGRFDLNEVGEILNVSFPENPSAPPASIGSVQIRYERNYMCDWRGYDGTWKVKLCFWSPSYWYGVRLAIASMISHELYAKETLERGFCWLEDSHLMFSFEKSNMFINNNYLRYFDGTFERNTSSHSVIYKDIPDLQPAV